MKKNYLLASLLGAAALLSSCSSDDFAEQKAVQTGKTYQVSVVASKGEICDMEDADMQTRAVFIGGNSNRYANMWDDGDTVIVFKNGVYAGFLLPSEADKGTKEANLSGSLTGTFAVNDNVELYITGQRGIRPSERTLARDYTGQIGTINDMSAKYAYQTRTVKVASVVDDNITLAPANMNNRQAYLWLLPRDEEQNLLHPDKLVISAEPTNEVPGRIVTSIDADGVPTYGDLIIEPEYVPSTIDYPGELFIAILNEGFDESSLTHDEVNYRLTAYVNDEVYVSKSIWKKAPTIGGLTRAARTMEKFNTSTTIAGNIAALEAGTDLGTGAAADASIIANQWTTGDKLTVWTGNISADTKATDFTCAAGGSAAGSFTSNLKFNAAPSSSTTLTAYAQSPALTVDDAAGTITLDLTEQDGTLANVQNYDLMWGNTTYDTKSIAFGHKVAFLKYNLDLGAASANKTATIELSGSTMYSTVTFNASDGTEKSKLIKQITVNDVAVDAEGKASVYVALYPGTYKDAQAWVTMSDGKQCPVAIGNGAFTLEAGKVYTASAAETPIEIANNVGYFLNSDGTFTQTASANSVAVVFSNKVTLNDWKAGYKNGYAMALKIAEGEGTITWDNQTSAYTYITQDLPASTSGYLPFKRDGITETNLLCALGDDRGNAAKTARSFSAVPGCSQWFLPAIGQLNDICITLGGLGSLDFDENRRYLSARQTLNTNINNIISAAGEGNYTSWDRPNLTGSDNALFYWSSTELSKEYALYIVMAKNNNVVLDHRSTNYKSHKRDFRVRPCIAF